MSYVDKLPPEIWLMIASYLDLKQLNGPRFYRSAARPDHTRLALTCRALCNVAQQSMFRYLDFEILDRESTPSTDQRIGLGPHRFYDRLGLLTRAWERNADTVQCVQELNYRSTYMYHQTFGTFIKLLAKGRSLIALNTTECFTEDLNMLTTLLMQPGTFSNLRTVSIHSARSANDSRALLGAILRKPLLETAVLDFEVSPAGSGFFESPVPLATSLTGLRMLHEVQYSLVMSPNYHDVIDLLFHVRGTERLVFGSRQNLARSPLHERMTRITRTRFDLDPKTSLQKSLESATGTLEELEFIGEQGKLCIPEAELTFASFKSLRYLHVPISIFQSTTSACSFTDLLPVSLESLSITFELDYHLTGRSSEELITQRVLKVALATRLPWIGSILTKPPATLARLKTLTATEVLVLQNSRDESFYPVYDVSSLFADVNCNRDVLTSVLVRFPTTWKVNELLREGL